MKAAGGIAPFSPTDLRAEYVNWCTLAVLLLRIKIVEITIFAPKSSYFRHAGLMVLQAWEDYPDPNCQAQPSNQQPLEAWDVG